ncbi:hypothetical protein RN001_004912 [Aquatica leii]|uniref:ZP domain-containing protein n=1 Tax=Aquatica leii TaxID=1421715 RepID=A0AAN7SPP6_9COLE|nr:hypothetical protein RN001_004912 [Aquatica leii]
MAQYIIILLVCLWSYAASQSNYADQANNIEYVGEGLPQFSTLDGKVTKLDDLSPVIFLNRTKAALNCAAGSMQIELKFNDKFYGIAYADFDRNSACQVAGKGATSYKLELPLKGCGTKQDPQRVFTNNIVVRFHPGLEMDGDEIITIVCRYPPPVTMLPIIPDYVAHVTDAPVLGPVLNGFQILLIICGILFLSLLLLGLGCSYYCLRRRNEPIIAPFSSIGSESEITKLSGSSLGNLSMFEGLKIPRAHAPVLAPGSTSGSEGPLISDTLPSDYPSESHSEIECDTRSLPVSSAGSFDNKGYLHDNSSFYSEGYGHTQEQSIQNSVAVPVTSPRLPMAIKDQPKFDVQVRVKKAPPPSPPSLSDTESSIARTERNLSTILEQREESVRSIESPMVERTQFTYVPELHAPPKHIQPAPTFTRILRRQQEMHDEHDAPRLMPARSLTSLNTEMTDTHSLTEIVDTSHSKFIAPVPPPPPPIIPKQRYIVSEQPPRTFEPPIAVTHKPEITSHMVDDVFLKTITEKKTIEDIERHKRLITEYHARPKPVDQKWDVTIKNYPVELPEPPEWENFSDVSSASGLTLTPKMERAQMSLPPQNQIKDNKLPLNSPELVGSINQHASEHEITSETYLSTFKIPRENPQVPNWNVLIRVLQPLDEEGPVLDTAESFNSQLTMADRMKWRHIITTESTLKTMLSEAIIREDFEKIRQDRRYERLFEPPKWDVIIRILTPDRPKNQSRFRKKTDWDNRSRRSSLPTLYEYDSDGGSSVRTLTNEPMVQPNLPSRGRRPSRSSYRSEADLRSMSEVTVDFGRPDQPDYQSESSSYYPGPPRYYDDTEIVDYQHPSLARSLSQPSLARSASEFTERWIAPSRYDTASEFTSPEGTPKSQRSTKIQPFHVPRGSGQHSSVWQESSHVGSTPGGAQIMTQEYRREMTTSFRTTNQNWFGDNESETSYK